MRVTCNRPWLTFDLGEEMQVLSWAINRPGLVFANRILWREVRDADLPPELDVEQWLAVELSARNDVASVCFLTSRDVRCHEIKEALAGELRAEVVATVGLSNAERVGFRQSSRARWGTINIAIRLSQGLSSIGLIEAATIAAEARTAAVMDVGFHLPQGLATGTGTDCIAVAAPQGMNGYAGLHTEVGEVIGAAVYGAVRAGAENWKGQNRRSLNDTN